MVAEASPYPQLPFAKLVRVEPGDELTTGERSTYFATNVDYTFCDLRDRPLFSIEFDGIGGGFSRAGKYEQGRPTPDPHRKLKMDFKLPVARQVLYPLVVVSFPELEELDADASLTILDGIVARLVTKHEEAQLIDRMVEEHRHDLEILPKRRGQDEGAPRSRGRRTTGVRCLPCWPHRMLPTGFGPA